ncbi:MAG: SDR family oxidoreductase [Clostridia bacterium]|nr:SDR family oxidoreductase [Clostridia bacterium]
MKNIIITGAGDGVGKAIVSMLKSENLILVDIEKDNVEAVAKNLNQKAFVCDVSDTKQVKKLKEFVIKTFDKIDCLINCAGMWTKGEISQLGIEHFAKINDVDRVKKLIDTNFFGIVAMINEFAPIMMKQNYGQIININSQSGVEVEEFCPIYNASKHGSYAYRKAIQRDLAKHNVKITDVCPGLIKTNFYVRANDKLPEEIMCLGLEPEDVAKTVLYVLNLPHEITIPSIEVRHIKNY